MERSFFIHMPKLLSLIGLICLSVPLAACSSAQSVKQAKGRFFITCEKGIDDCISRADKTCGDEGFTIISGYQKKKLLGGSSSSYRTAVFIGELNVICGEVPREETSCVTSSSPVEVDPQAPELSESAPRVCVPGSSQACVGSAGCQGGQYCLSDGSGFGRCDCGTKSSSSPVSSTPRGEKAEQSSAAPNSVSSGNSNKPAAVEEEAASLGAQGSL